MSREPTCTRCHWWDGPVCLCGGSGRRLHDWATGWYPADKALWPNAARTVEYTVGYDALRGEWRAGAWRCDLTADLTLVLSDPSHRPEPLRWKQ